MNRYINRKHAGEILANELKNYANRPDTIVLALPRGGVPIAYEIAKKISAPLDLMIVRKLGMPGHKELAIGAIASGGIVVFNDEIILEFNISKDEINAVIKAEQQELKRRELAYRGNRSLPILTNKIVILVDDGIATGATIKSAIQAVREQHPAKLIVAVPVAEFTTSEKIAALADEMVCPLKPQRFYAVGEWYEDFPQTTDNEVRELLQQLSIRK